MIRLEGASLPDQSRGQIVPYAFGDVLLDVPGIPLQVGHSAVLAENCGADDTQLVFDLSGPDRDAIVALPVPLVAQIDQEWVRVVSFTASPFTMTVDARGFGGTIAAAHAKGATVLIVESRAIYVFLEAPTGLRYPDDALVELRVNDNAQTPPCTFRLQDDRIVDGHRLVTAEFDLTRYFGGVTPPPAASSLVFSGFDQSAFASAYARTPAVPQVFRGGGIGAITPLQRVRLAGRPTSAPPAPTLPRGAFNTQARPTAAPIQARRIIIQSSPLGTVTADLKGLLDTVGGRYTGTPSAPILRPSDVARVKMELTYTQDATGFHEPSWLATRAFQASQGLTWRSLWYGDSFESFRANAGFCGLADLWIDDSGLWRYTYQDRAAAPVATITSRELIGEMALDFIPPTATRLAVEWGANRQAGAFTLESATMQARHGVITDKTLALPYAPSEAVARTLALHWRKAWDHPRLTAGRVALAPVLSALTRTDHVMVDTPLLELYGARRVPWEIRATTDRGDQRIAVLIEGDPIDTAEGGGDLFGGPGSIWQLMAPDTVLVW